MDFVIDVCIVDLFNGFPMYEMILLQMVVLKFAANK